MTSNASQPAEWRKRYSNCLVFVLAHASIKTSSVFRFPSHVLLHCRSRCCSPSQIRCALPRSARSCPALRQCTAPDTGCFRFPKNKAPWLLPRFCVVFQMPVCPANWNLCQCELNLIKFICYCVLSPCLLKAYSTIESLSIYIILKNPQRRGIRTLAYCV